MPTGDPVQGGEPPRPGADTGPARVLVDGRYALQQQIGRGGMGVVWEALDTRLNRQVAVKELLFRGAVDPETQAQWAERARREAQAIARIGHEHVVAVHDVIEADGQVWIVMEQVDPRSLADLLRDQERLSAGAAARIGLEVLRGLRAVHAAGVLHRDVKPHNVLFRRDGRAVLMDFGIATFEGAARLTRWHETVGTPHYLPPELAAPWGGEPRQATPASDLWSLGVTLFEMVEGRAPFRGPTPYEVLEAVREAPLPEMEHAGPLRPLIEGLLVKDPERRLTADRAEELLRHVAQETPQASVFPPYTPGDSGTTRPPRPAPPARRRPAPSRRARRAALAGVVTIALLLGGSWLAMRFVGGEERPSLSRSATFREAERRGYLVIGVKADQPGLSQVGNDKEETYSGFDIEVAKAIAADLGFAENHQFFTVNTAGREYRLEKGDVDLIVASYSITDRRKQAVDFAGPYLLAGQDFLVRKDSGIDGREDLDGKKICTVSSSTPSEQIRQNVPKATVTTRDQYGRCVQDLLTGAVDAVTTDDIILLGFRAEHPDELKLLNIPFSIEKYGVGLPKGDSVLKERVCDSLREHMRNGDLQKWYKKFLSPLEEEPQDRRTLPKTPTLTECGQS